MKDKDFYLNINIIIGGENGDTNFTTIEKKFIFDLETRILVAWLCIQICHSKWICFYCI
jgi:hypothetical protein